MRYYALSFRVLKLPGKIYLTFINVKFLFHQKNLIVLKNNFGGTKVNPAKIATDKYSTIAENWRSVYEEYVLKRNNLRFITQLPCSTKAYVGEEIQSRNLVVVNFNYYTNLNLKIRFLKK